MTHKHTSQVVIMSVHDDAHIPFVIKHLEQESIIIDNQDIITGKAWSHHVKTGKDFIAYGDQRLDDIRGVWLRRPRHITREVGIPVDDAYRAYSQSALRQFTEMFFVSFPNATWVSDYYAIIRAENKILQQREALKLGFVTPDTLYTSDPNYAKQFMSEAKSIIIKHLARQFPHKVNGKPAAFYTYAPKPGEVIDFGGLNLAPAIFQAKVDPVTELRVTVVGSKVFAARIDITKVPDWQARDWRIEQSVGNTRFSTYDLPKDIAQKCVQLTKRLGLKYGAIDFILDKKGIYWFLEINPNGQWAFVEEETGQPIGKAMAHLLQHRKRS